MKNLIKKTLALSILLPSLVMADWVQDAAKKVPLDTFWSNAAKEHKKNANLTGTTTIIANGKRITRPSEKDHLVVFRWGKVIYRDGVFYKKFKALPTSNLVCKYTSATVYALVNRATNPPITADWATWIRKPRVDLTGCIVGLLADGYNMSRSRLNETIFYNLSESGSPYITVKNSKVINTGIDAEGNTLAMDFDNVAMNGGGFYGKTANIRVTNSRVNGADFWQGHTRSIPGWVPYRNDDYPQPNVCPLILNGSVVKTSTFKGSWWLSAGNAEFYINDFRNSNFPAPTHPLNTFFIHGSKWAGNTFFYANVGAFFPNAARFTRLFVHNIQDNTTYAATGAEAGLSAVGTPKLTVAPKFPTVGKI